MRRAALVATTLAIAALLAFGLTPAGAQSEEERLDQIEAEIKALESQIDNAESVRQETVTLLAETQARLDAIRAQLAEAQGALDTVLAAIGAKEAEIAELERQIGVLEAALAQTQLEQLTTRNQLRDRAVDLYMNGSYALGQVVLSVDDATNVSIGVAYAENLIDNTSFLLRSLEALENQELAQRAGLEERRTEEQGALAELEEDRAEAEQRRQAVDELRHEVADELAAQESMLASINREIAELDGDVATLEAEAARIQKEIEARQSQGGSNPGRLSWPVRGRITSPFGYRIHPITGVQRLHTGLDLAGAPGQNIRAAGAGTVILAGWYGGYGYTVVIDHGGGLSTLYAHQSRVNVSRGQTVSTGDVIGFVGSTGASTGPHLHFETREYGTPVNPMGYLGG